MCTANYYQTGNLFHLSCRLSSSISSSGVLSLSFRLALFFSDLRFFIPIAYYILEVRKFATLERLGILHLNPCDDLLFFDLPVSRLAGDGSNQLEFEVLIVRECLCLVVGDFEQYRECELCGP